LKSRYRRLLGKLNYLTITRPAILYAVCVVKQFFEALRVSHWEAVIHIIRYLKSALSLGILYRPNGHLRVEWLTDADWASSLPDRQSTIGYCTFLGGNMVAWKSKKWAVVTWSCAEAKYRAMSNTTS
jgi:hypothetical protein